MTALNFPTSPSDGDTFDNYIYDGTRAVWRLQPNIPDISSKFQVSATAPTNPVNGEVWLNSTDGNTYIYYVDGDSSQWIEIGGNTAPPPDINDLNDVVITTPADEQALVYDSGTGNWINADVAGGVEVSATAPAAPSAGDLWWNSTEGDLFVYYNDGDSSQWVPASGPKVTVQDTSPTGYEGQLWLDSTDGSMYVYYTDPGGGSSSWIGAVSRSGGILQVVSTTKTDKFSASVASGNQVSVTGLSVNITPRSTSSKILVCVSMTAIGGGGTSGVGVILKRGATAVGVGDSAGNRTRINTHGGPTGASDGTGGNQSVNFLDSPSTTSTVTYSIDIHNVSGSTETLVVNGSNNDADTAVVARSASTITLMEVAG